MFIWEVIRKGNSSPTVTGLEPPLHMPVVFGPVVRKKLLKPGTNQKKASSNSASSSQSGTVTSSQSVAVTSPHKKCSTNLQVLTDEQLLYEEMSDCAVCYKLIQVNLLAKAFCIFLLIFTATSIVMCA